jgi:hypothetical protein
MPLSWYYDGALGYRDGLSRYHDGLSGWGFNVRAEIR